MILDCIDTMDMLDLVGGDPSAWQEVIRKALIAQNTSVAPYLIIRLAASPAGQGILKQLPRIDMPPAWDALDDDLRKRLTPHLVSPHWDTAPPPLRTWWEHTITQVNQSPHTYLLTRALSLYPTVAPQVAIGYPQIALIERALRHPEWGTIPEPDRRAALHTAFRKVPPLDIATIGGDAATDVARQAVLAVVADLPHLSDNQKTIIRPFVDPNA